MAASAAQIKALHALIVRRAAPYIHSVVAISHISRATTSDPSFWRTLRSEAAAPTPVAADLPHAEFDAIVNTKRRLEKAVEFICCDIRFSDRHWSQLQRPYTLKMASAHKGGPEYAWYLAVASLYSSIKFLLEAVTDRDFLRVAQHCPDAVAYSGGTFFYRDSSQKHVAGLEPNLSAAYIGGVVFLMNFEIAVANFCALTAVSPSLSVSEIVAEMAPQVQRKYDAAIAEVSFY